MAKKANKKIRVTKSLWGKFNLPYRPGTDVSIDSKLASELIKEGFAISAADAAKAEKDTDEGTEEKE